MSEHPWLDEPAPPSPRRGRVMMVLAALPWLAVVALLVVPFGGTPDAGSRGDVPPPTAPAEVDPAAHGEESVGAAATGALSPVPADTSIEVPIGDPDGDLIDDAGEDPGGEGEDPGAALVLASAPAANGERALGAYATLVARAWLTGVGPQLDGVELPRRDAGGFAEHLSVERIHVEGELALVSILGVLLGTSDEPDPPRLVRVVVPLAHGSPGLRAVGTPYELDVEAPAASTLIAEPIADELLDEARVALERSGVDISRLHGVERTPAGPLVAHLGPGTDRRPDGETDLDVGTTVQRWLHRDEAGELVVFGLDGERRPS